MTPVAGSQPDQARLIRSLRATVRHAAVATIALVLLASTIVACGGPEAATGVDDPSDMVEPATRQFGADALSPEDVADGRATSEGAVGLVGVDAAWPAATDGLEYGKNAVAYIDPLFVSADPGIDQTTDVGRAWYDAWLEAKLADYRETYRRQLERLERLGYDTVLDADGPNAIAVGLIGEPVPGSAGASCEESALRQIGFAADDVVVGVAVPFDSLAEAETFATSWGDGANIAYPWVEC